MEQNSSSFYFAFRGFPAVGVGFFKGFLIQRPIPYRAFMIYFNLSMLQCLSCSVESKLCPISPLHVFVFMKVSKPSLPLPQTRAESKKKFFFFFFLFCFLFSHIEHGKCQLCQVLDPSSEKTSILVHASWVALPNSQSHDHPKTRPRLAKLCPTTLQCPLESSRFGRITHFLCWVWGIRGWHVPPRRATALIPQMSASRHLS